MFELSPFFHSFPSIRREDLTETAETLEKMDLVSKQHEPLRYRLTSSGLRLLESQTANPEPRYLQGLRYQHMEGPLWERLTLLIQVCSNLIHHQNSYIPVQRRKETIEWVKSFIIRQSNSRETLAENLYSELADCLESEIRNELRPSFFVMRLTGYNRIGLTSRQAAERAGVELSYFHLQFLNVLHFVIYSITTHKERYPLLASLVTESGFGISITVSAEKTYQLLLKGYTLEQVASIRNLKKSTIEDHIVEIALSVKDFDINPYVTIEKQQRIGQVAAVASYRKLKDIREQAPDANYFEIRLSMARLGDQS